MPTLNVPNDFTNGTTADAAQVNANFTAVESWGNGTLADDNFSSTAGMYSGYRTIHQASGYFPVDAASATYFFSDLTMVATGSTGSGFVPRAVYLDDADYAISGRTIKLRVRGNLLANATAPGINFTVGLAGPVTVAGTADAVTFTLGSAVSGSTVALNTPPASTATPISGADFTIPADGTYALFITTSGTLANNAWVGVNAQLQLRWV